MIVLRKIVSLNTLQELFQDLTYSKVEIQPTEMKKLKDKSVIAVRLYFKCKPYTVNEVRGCLLKYSRTSDLPIEIRSKIGGFQGNFSTSNYITLSDFNNMIEIEKEYKLNFGIPKLIKEFASNN